MRCSTSLPRTACRTGTARPAGTAGLAGLAHRPRSVEVDGRAARLGRPDVLRLGHAHRSDAGRSLAPAGSPKRDHLLPERARSAAGPDLLDVALASADDDDPVHLRDHAALELLYASGMRVSELVGLDVDDVDVARRVVRVVGKGDKERVVPFGVPARRRSGRGSAAAARAWPPAPAGRRCCSAARPPGRPAPGARRPCTGSSRTSRTPATSARTGCGTAPRPTCSKAARTCAPFRSCSVTLRSRRPRSTPTCPSRGCRRRMSRRTPGRDGGRRRFDRRRDGRRTTRRARRSTGRRAEPTDEAERRRGGRRRSRRGRGALRRSGGVQGDRRRGAARAADPALLAAGQVRRRPRRRRVCRRTSSRPTWCPTASSG